MGSKERIIRQKEETRVNILKAAREIVKDEGWQGLSMRKIADKIEYTAPIIYEYFANKEAILQELTCKGFRILTKDLETAKAGSDDAAEQLENMWLAYWNFALENKEMYQLMYGVEMTCCAQRNTDTDAPYVLITNVIKELMDDDKAMPEVIKQKYFTFFSVIHGLISINIVGNGLSEQINKQILKDAINGIIRYIKEE